MDSSAGLNIRCRKTKSRRLEDNAIEADATAHAEYVSYIENENQ